MLITDTYQTAGAGLRAQKSVTYSGTTTTGTFDGDLYRQTTPVSTTLYYERDPAGRLLVLTNGVTVYYYGRDGHGSVTTLTDHSGALKNFYTYDPYGNSLYKVETASLANPWQYAGGYRDAESGLYLLGVRYYSSGLGRFLQQDPLGGGGNSQYAYAGSDPCNNSDPSGMKTCYHRVTGEEVGQASYNDSVAAGQAAKGVAVATGAAIVENFIPGIGQAAAAATGLIAAGAAYYAGVEQTDSTILAGPNNTYETYGVYVQYDSNVWPWDNNPCHLNDTSVRPTGAHVNIVSGDPWNEFL